jgi:hypothetical protein
MYYEVCSKSSHWEATSHAHVDGHGKTDSDDYKLHIEIHAK